MLFPVAQLIEGRDKPLCVSKDTKVNDALTLMIENDYSQLPVIDEDGDLCGIISESSIVSMYYHIGGTVSLLDLTVDHCQTPPITISPESDIFEALALLQNVYAIVVVENQKPVGIVTDYDTAHFFNELSEGLILVEDIEVTLRQHIEDVFCDEGAMYAALMRAFKPDKRDHTRPAREYEELSFGEHIQLIITEDNWSKFKGVFEPKNLFIQFMQQVGQIRNKLAHFRGRLDPVQRHALMYARDWLAARPKLAPPLGEQEQTVRVSAEEVPTERLAGKYTPLKDWLVKRKYQVNNIRVSFRDIETLLGAPLPPSARKHRSWWANDHTTHAQSLAWLEAGWRVDDADLPAEEVVFRRTDSVLMQLFFADLLTRLKKARPGITRASKTYPENWWSFGAGRTGFNLGWCLPGTGGLRVELYIDTEDKERNKAAFDALFAQREQIEQKIGSALNGERLDDKRASRISLLRPYAITDPPDEQEQAKEWAIETMLRFADAFQVRIKEL